MQQVERSDANVDMAQITLHLPGALVCMLFGLGHEFGGFGEFYQPRHVLSMD